MRQRFSSLVLLVACGAATACHSSRKATTSAAPARNTIVGTARKYLGAPYRYGGGSPKTGFDCSGYVQFVFGLHGVRLPRTTKDLYHFGKTVSLKKARVADLILFTGSDASGPVGHVGIIIRPEGTETAFIHAGSSAKNGGVIISDLTNSYYSKRFLKVIDVL